MKHFYIITLIIFLYSLSPCTAQTSPINCYDNQKIQLILRFKENNKAHTFTTYSDWTNRGLDENVLSSDFRWFTRTGKGEELDDAELFEYLGREKDAERIRQTYESERKRATTQLAIGIPLGLAMLIGGISWYSNLSDAPEPSVEEKGSAIALSLAGTGIITVPIIRFLNSRHRSPTDHKITDRQALDITDRYNRALKMKCGLEE